MRKIDLLLIGTELGTIRRAEDISAEFGYAFYQLPSVDAYSDKVDALGEPTLILLSAETVEKENDIAGMVQVIKQFATESYVIVAINSKLDPKVAVFVKKSGADVVLLGTEVRETSKLEFLISQKIKSSYMPVKVNEVVVNTTLECSLFHLMPLNKKFMPVIHANDNVTAERLDRLKEIGEIYVRRDDVDKFRKYTNQFDDKSAASLSRRCRAQFMSLVKSYTELVTLITDQSEFASYKEGAELYNKCVSLSDELMSTLGSVGNAWDIVNNSAIGEFGSIERSPAIASYSGLLSLHSQIGNQSHVMVAALISNLGMLDLNPRITKKIRQGAQVEDLHEEDRKDYLNHPTASLNKALARKLQIPEEVKHIILCTHERVDQKGFPNRPRPEKIPMESMIVQFCERIDQHSLVKMGQERPDMNQVKKKLISTEAMAGAFSFLFVEKVKKYIDQI